jgi:NodT family efflux transporter outer membrane factor (OMF) lipoprotein
MKHWIAVLGCAAALGGCAAPRGPLPAAPELPAQWYAPPLAHQGSRVELAQWWSRLGDPVLSDWIARAQAQSPSVAAARAQVVAARAAVSASETLAGPQVAAVASATRGRPDASTPLGHGLAVGLQASWVIDLWGGAAAETAGARAQQDAAGAGWHEARVLVAAEVAQLYMAQRLCRAQLAVATSDRDSRGATARSTAVSESVGLTAPAVLALAQASHAEAQARTQAQAALCERQIKALVALTALPEPELRAQLARTPGLQLAAMPSLAVQAVPAQVIRQRPDVYRAQRELVAAGEAAGAARALLLPNLSLSGSWLRNRFSTREGSANFSTWSVGPLSLNLPLIGRSALTANADAAQARYEAAAQAYAATLRQAVAEVEQALVTLDGLALRLTATEAAQAGYVKSFGATEARHRVGLASLNELEDARRLRLNAESSTIALQQERFSAWVALYLALGGGFDPAQPQPTP